MTAIMESIGDPPPISTERIGEPRKQEVRTSHVRLVTRGQGVAFDSPSVRTFAAFRQFRGNAEARRAGPPCRPGSRHMLGYGPYRHRRIRRIARRHQFGAAISRNGLPRISPFTADVLRGG
jgi:hypothetical protein